jgi:hypothetical protein
MFLILSFVIYPFCMAQDSSSVDSVKAKPSGGLILGVGGASFDSIRLETAVGIDVGKDIVLQGQIGASEDGQTRVGFGMAIKFWQSPKTIAFFTTSYSPEEEIDSRGYQYWVTDKLVWGGGIYYRPLKLGVYVHKVDDVTSKEDRCEIYVFRWMDIIW